MVPILNRPFLEHMIEYLRGHGIDDIILALCYLPDRIREHFGDGSAFGVKLTYVTEHSPLGTAGAVKNVERQLDDFFFVFNGDVFTDLDLTDMLQVHRRRRATVTIALTPVENPSIYGVVETEGDGRVKRFVEKPRPDAVTTNMINAGTYILEREALEGIPGECFCMFEHNVFPQLVDAGEGVYGHPSDAYWIDIGTPEKYLKLHHDLLQRQTEVSVFGEGVCVEGDCDVHPDAELVGPVIIGRNSVLGPQVKVMGPSVIGAACRIGASAHIEAAVVWSNTRLGQGVSARGCVIAENVSVGDGSQILERSVLGDNVIVGTGETVEQGARRGE